jgi:hypothetical protein
MTAAGSVFNDRAGLVPSEVAAVRLPADELASFRSMTLDEATVVVVKPLARRLRWAMAVIESGGGDVYLEDGLPTHSGSGS